MFHFMAHQAPGSRTTRHSARIAIPVGAGLIFGALLFAAPASAQTLVFGDIGGQACYEAAAFGNDSRYAIDQCTRAIDSDTLSRTDRAATYHNRGIIRRMRGELDDAMADYEASQRIEPDMPESYVSEGNLHFVKGDYAAAISAYDAALARGLSPTHVAYLNRGLVYERIGDLDAAEREFRAAADAAPDWRPPRESLDRIEQQRANAAMREARGGS